MAAATTGARLVGCPEIAEMAREESTMSYARNSLLSEWPGLVFGLVTVAYLVISLVALI